MANKIKAVLAKTYSIIYFNFHCWLFSGLANDSFPHTNLTIVSVLNILFLDLPGGDFFILKGLDPTNRKHEGPKG